MYSYEPTNDQPKIYLMNQSEIDSCGFGLLINLNNQKSAELVEVALKALARLTHRGTIGEDGLSGDGCGIMLQLDHKHFKNLAEKSGIVLTKDRFALGMCFLNPKKYKENQLQLELSLIHQGFKIAGWRDVPVNLNYIGKGIKQTPKISQLFIEFPEDWSIALVEKKLFIAKKSLQPDTLFSIVSLSSQTIIYKGLVLPSNLPLLYTDLQDKNLSSSVAIVHQRFSTNTLSTWDLAQPFSTLAHNGEINTIQGNRHYAQQLGNSLIQEYFPELIGLDTLINMKGSDSQNIDNLLESFIQAGFSSYEALRIMIPPAWEENEQMESSVRAYFRYHAPLMPPWEGPAGIVFFDGRFAGCILDRNGFRPARIVKSHENWLGIGSEIGIFDLENQKITELSRVKPGELLIIDLEKGEWITPYKFQYQYPYSKWMQENTIELADNESLNCIKSYSPDDDFVYKRFDVSFEEKEDVLRYMIENAMETTASMGDDTPLAALSENPRQLFEFFRQQFAQVTNPPIDSLREKLVMSLQTYLGNRGLITQRCESFAEKIQLESPLLTAFQINKLYELPKEKYNQIHISLTYSPNVTLKEALIALSEKMNLLDHHKHNMIILSDESINQNSCLIHPTLAIGSLHHWLIKHDERKNTSLIVNSGWIREAHHVAILIAAGADAVYPWLAYQLIYALSRENHYEPLEALSHYRLGINKGLLKICSKNGVCTINSYRGAQLFYVIGLDKEIVSTCFSQCHYLFEKYNWETLDNHQKLFLSRSQNTAITMSEGGLYKYTPQGEYHDYNPDVVTSLLRAVNEQDERYYQQFKELINHRKPVMVRDFLQLKFNQTPIKLEDVEEASSIIKRFDTAAMSLGSLSPEAHETLAIGMNTLGGRSNSGEGGEASYRNKTLAQSKIKQIASGRFGVTAEYLMHAEVIQIKIAQGAKPGEGGQLAGNKVSKMIAELRYCHPNTTLISPPPHHDIYSIEDLSQLIFDLKQINPNALISVKLVSSPGIGTIAAGVVKAYADMITISGYDGGTGASPLSSIRYTGCPWEFGISETQRVLIENNLRHRVMLQVDGGLKTGLDVIKGAILGAESFGFGTAALITLGCKYLRICHLNNCATGIASQDERIRKHLYTGKHQSVMLYFQWVAEEVRVILAQLGFKKLKDIIGRVDLLRSLENYEKCAHSILSQPIPDSKYQEKLYLNLKNSPFDKALLAKQIYSNSIHAIKKQTSFKAQYEIGNHDRSIGANIAGEIAMRYGDSFQGNIHLHFRGVAGQSFATWLVHGLTFTLDGIANDYVAKGMSGGEVIIKAFQNNPLATIAGNTCLYGATGGICYIDGAVGERFAVRNSGAVAVVVKVGNHGCEYMTLGKIVILTTPGDNFAAGMTGGIAFVYDDKQLLNKVYNPETVNLHTLDQPELYAYKEELTQLLKDFFSKTQSSLALKFLENMNQYLSDFYLIIPKDIDPFARDIS